MTRELREDAWPRMLHTCGHSRRFLCDPPGVPVTAHLNGSSLPPVTAINSAHLSQQQLQPAVRIALRQSSSKVYIFTTSDSHSHHEVEIPE